MSAGCLIALGLIGAAVILGRTLSGPHKLEVKVVSHNCECKRITVSDHALVDCGCTVKVHTDGSGVEIYYCPMHRAAEDLLLSLEEVKEELKAAGRWTDLTQKAQDNATDALAAAREVPG